MITKYYSEVLNKTFDTEEACANAEAKYKEEHSKELALKEERKTAAAEVEKLYKEANDKLKEANKALSDFCSKYGSYHKTYTRTDIPTLGLFDIFDKFWF